MEAVAGTRPRVVQWATGTTGRQALRAVIDSPDLDLVGVRVYDSAKVGSDAGDIAGTGPTGVTAIDTIDDVLRLTPDVVLYMANAERHTDACFRDVAELLAAGIDVVATGSPFIDVRANRPDRAETLHRACQEGGGSFLGLGLFPGFWGETIVPLLTRLSFRRGQITIRESLSYAGYPSAAMIFDVMGFGRPVDSGAVLARNPGHAAKAFRPTATLIAKALGLKVESTDVFRETALTQDQLTVAVGEIPAETVGAIRLGVRADCGPVQIVVEHTTWMDPAVAPEWSSSEGYEIVFDGAPTLRCNLVLGIEGEDHTEMGCLATAMHAVHAIPVVRQAPAGLLDLADIPAFTGRIG